MTSLGAGLDEKTKTELEAIYKKASAGDAESQFLLGGFFDTGKMGMPIKPDQAEIWYGKAAAQGYALGQNALGTLYNGEKLGAPDYGQAIQWFRAAAEQGHPLAEYNLGYMYYAGRGIKTDQREALRWIGKSAAKGFQIAQFTLGKMLDSGTGLVNKNQPEAFRWYLLAANQGYGQAQYRAAVMLFQGHGTPQDFVGACRWMRLAANQNVSRANEALTEMKQVLDREQAVEVFNSVANFQRKTEAESKSQEPDVNALAPSLAYGRRPMERATIPFMVPDEKKPEKPIVPSVADISQTATPVAASPSANKLPTMPRTTASGATPTAEAGPAPPAATKRPLVPNPVVAKSTPPAKQMAMAKTKPAVPSPSPPALTPPAAGSLPPVSEYAPIELVRLKYKAEQGDAESQFQLGRVFARGDRVNQNFSEAVKWHTRAAQQSHDGAQAALGTMHYWGRGAAQDTTRAAQWLLLSAEQGNATAQFWLGMIYERGDPKERLKWFREAAENGSTLGQTYVAGLYLSGTAGEADPIEAYKWLELAANKGSQNAKDMRAALADVLSEKEIEAAKNRAMQFIPKRKMAPLAR
jgi:TPR repeat protein